MTLAPPTMLLSPRVLLYEAGFPPSHSLPANGLALPHPPSSAFGDGSHPTTRLMAGATDLLCRQRKPSSVLDVGTGTGVLARIARARGATHLVATDIDPVALQAARANIALDQHSVEIQVTDHAPDTWGPRFDLVIANILEGPLRLLAPALCRSLAPGGTLILSGFTPLQVPGLQLTYANLGLHRLSEAHLDGWALILAQLPKL